MPAPNVLTADVFETGIIQTSRAIKQVKVKIKIKFAPDQAMKVQKLGRSIALLFL
jgi:hypothetical protein